MPEQLFWQVLGPRRGPTLKQLVKNYSPWEGFMLDKFMENYLPWVGPHTGAREEHEEEGAAQTTRDELTATPISHPPVNPERPHPAGSTPTSPAPPSDGSSVHWPGI